MKTLVIAALAALCLAASCGDLLSEPVSGSNSTTALQLCPDSADAYAQANGLALPYPANPANPTPYSPLLPPPYFFHACLSSVGAPTSRGGLPCMVCTDSTDQYADLLPGSLDCLDEDSDGNPIVCVGSLRAGDPTECDAASQGCQ